VQRRPEAIPVTAKQEIHSEGIFHLLIGFLDKGRGRERGGGKKKTLEGRN